MKKIVGVFGGLLVLIAFVFVPVRRTTVTEKPAGPGLITRTTSIAKTFVTLPAYFGARGVRIKEGTGARVTTVLRPAPYAAELGIIALLGIFDIFFFRLRRRR
jgi:hypothetical protein